MDTGRIRQPLSHDGNSTLGHFKVSHDGYIHTLLRGSVCSYNIAGRILGNIQSYFKYVHNTSIFSNMDGPRNYHAKWSQLYNETPTSNAFTDMWNLKKGQTELLCRTDADSQTLKNLWSPEETVWGVGGCAWTVGWKSCEVRLLWSLYNYRCDKFIWVIKRKKKKNMYALSTGNSLYRNLLLEITGVPIVAQDNKPD